MRLFHSGWRISLAALAKLSRFPINGFIPGSDFGDTRAQEEIWENWDDFQEKMRGIC